MIPPHLLERIPLLADGSPGDWLFALHKGARASSGGLPESITLRKPEWVQAAHDAFFQAGARVIRTNTAQANAVSLAALDLAERCEAVNNSAMALARAAVGQQALVVGTVGPIAATVALPDRQRAYAQQLVYFCDTGADFILLEGFESTEEAHTVLRLARDAGDAPVLAVLACDARGMMVDGSAVIDGLQQLVAADCDAIGVQFPADAADLLPLVEPTLALDAPTAVFLHGAPQGAGVQPLTPQAYAERLAPLATLRVVILGGGRHVFPEHVAALAQRIGPLQERA